MKKIEDRYTDDDNHVVVTFCDRSLAEETYQNSAWGSMEARGAYLKYAEKAQENDKVWAEFPHIVCVEVLMGEDKSKDRQSFVCPCTGKVLFSA